MASKWFRKLFPAPMAHIPTSQEYEDQDTRLTKEIVQQHAEGSVLLTSGNFELPEDLFAEEGDSQGGIK